MTSPAQLKYLDAMGIPVWVSRERVIEQRLVTDFPSENVVQSPSSAETTNSPKNLPNDNHSAQSILDSLNQPKIVKTPIKEVIQETVEKVTLPVNSIPQSPVEPKSDNLIHKSADHYVFASGNENADWMVIGHSPEPFTGIGDEPFAGEAGILLDNMIRAVGINNPRYQAYFLNVLDVTSSRSHSNQESESFKHLKKQLIDQINKIQPKVVLIVGQIAAQNLLHIDIPLIKMRSNIHTITDNKIPCVVTYYPSYLLQKPIDKRKAWDDLKLAMSAVPDVS